MKQINIKINALEWTAELLESPTANAIYNALPFSVRVQTWGDEIYFSIPIKHGLEPGAREIVEIGDLAFWPVGSAFCIFFGPTPASSDERPCAASPVNVFGKILGNTEHFKKVKSGEIVIVSK